MFSAVSDRGSYSNWTFPQFWGTLILHTVINSVMELETVVLLEDENVLLSCLVWVNIVKMCLEAYHLQPCDLIKMASVEPSVHIVLITFTAWIEIAPWLYYYLLSLSLRYYPGQTRTTSHIHEAQNHVHFIRYQCCLSPFLDENNNKTSMCR